MSDEPAYILDLEGLQDAAADGGQIPTARRPWIGVRFECCDVYARVYRNEEATAYIGRCPRCLREVRVRVGPGGTPARLFRAR